MGKEIAGIKHFSGQWTEKHLRHLLRRTLFGISRKDLAFFRGKSMAECVEVLLSDSPLPEPPRNYYRDPDVPEGGIAPFAAEHKGGIEELRIANLKGWWLGQMINQHRSLSEKMVLFWHNHFAVEFSMVKDSRYAYGYLNLLRQHALGNFRTLAREITVNPCMLVYLNGNSNNKSAPNENYGRELQELFTIGKGPDSHYTEGDVKAAAKVLSGWKDDKLKIAAYFESSAHDTGDKVFSAFYGNRKIKGRTGDEGTKETDELIEMICSQKEVSRFLCRKLYRWFVNSTIDAQVESDVIIPLAEVLVQSNYEIKPVLKEIFSGAFFYEPYLMGGMIKSPVDYCVSMFRAFDVQFADDDKMKLYKQWFSVAVWLGYLGQDIGDPPAVAGWPAYYEAPFFYKDWINSEMLSTRDKAARLLSFPAESDRLLMFDFVKFVDGLSTPADAKSVILESLNLCCGVLPGPLQLSYLESMLSNDQNKQQEWSEMWAQYKAQPTNADEQEKVKHRLAKVFSIIFALPEFHLM